MTDRQPRLLLHGRTTDITSPADISARLRTGAAPASLRVVMPVGESREKIVHVPTTRADLQALILAASAALIHLDAAGVDA